ncbi:hypothetical protein [Leisingera sp. JC11]|uniref:hypothetical protein n=1 Tax=Leisingera sp. JC11 TaxID=3042469 RepID=UPI0034567159
MMNEQIALTTNERAWLRFLRDLSVGSDPAPTLRHVQLLRRVLRRSSRRADRHGRA